MVANLPSPKGKDYFASAATCITREFNHRRSIKVLFCSCCFLPRFRPRPQHVQPHVFSWLQSQLEVSFSPGFLIFCDVLTLFIYSLSEIKTISHISGDDFGGGEREEGPHLLKTFSLTNVTFQSHPATLGWSYKRCCRVTRRPVFRASLNFLSDSFDARLLFQHCPLTMLQMRPHGFPP